MKTTVDLPKKLINEAMKISNISNKTDVIILALQDLIKKSEISELKKYKGKIDLGIRLDKLRKRQ